MTEYHSSFSKPGAFLFDAEALYALVKAAQTFVESDPTIAIDLAGGHKIEGTQVGLLFKDPYVKSKYIRSIGITGHAFGRPDRHVRINLQRGFDGLFEGPVEVQLSGDRNASISARDNIERLLKGQKQWYSAIKTPHQFLGVIFQGFILAVLTVIILVMSFRLFAVQILYPPSKIESSFVLLLLAVFVLLNVFAAKMFPNILFDIGRSSQKVKSAQHWRAILGVGVVLTGIVGLIVNLITERLTK